MKILLIFLISFFLTGCKERIYEEKNVDYFKIENKNIDVYSDIKINDILINNSSYEIISNNYQIDTNKLGEKEYEIYYLKDNKKYVYKFKLNVVDNIPPLVFSGTSKKVKIGYEGDLCNLITYGDNYTGDVLCQIDGDFDLQKEGEYKLKYTLSDSSKNKKEVKVNLTVYDPSKEDNSNSTSPKKETISFENIRKKYENEKVSLGIDVSKWQGEINFKKVKEAGASFVMIRIGYQDGVDGEIVVDSYFKENIKNAKANGLKVGVYFNSQAHTLKEIDNQAKWVIDTLDNETLDFPIAFDWENWSKWNSFKISFHTVNEMAKNFIKIMENNGYRGMMYGSKFYLETIWDDFDITWLAHYTDKTNYQGDYLMWQCANNGRISGIYGDVDIDILYE